MARSVPEPTPSSNRTVALVIAAVLALLVAVAVFWFWPKATRVPETVAIATGLLDLGGPPAKQTIRQLVANVDRMPRDELGQLWRAVGEDWRRRRQEAIDRYFTASAADKPLLLDAEIKRLVALRETRHLRGPGVHLRVDVDGVVGKPRGSRQRVPQPLQVRGQRTGPR